MAKVQLKNHRLLRRYRELRPMKRACPVCKTKFGIRSSNLVIDHKYRDPVVPWYKPQGPKINCGVCNTELVCIESKVPLLVGAGMILLFIILKYLLKIDFFENEAVKMTIEFICNIFMVFIVLVSILLSTILMHFKVKTKPGTDQNEEEIL